MFVLVATTTVKPNKGEAFAQAYGQHWLSSFRAQAGFKDELLFIGPGRPDVVAISLWDSRETAEAYRRDAWPGLLSAVAGIIDRVDVRTFQLAHSTLHAPGVAAFPPQSPITTDPTWVGA